MVLAMTEEELGGSIRKIIPQGDVVADQLKSFQKRSMIAVPGRER